MDKKSHQLSCIVQILIHAPISPAVEVKACMINYIQYFYLDVITYLYPKFIVDLDSL